jgi:hypothetical protein
MGTGKPRISTAVRVLLIALAAELEIDPVVAPELAPVQVAVQAPVIVQGVAEPEHARVVAELERVPVAAVLGRPRGRLAVAPRTRSATEAHHRDLAPLLAAEDLAAAAETTREPAAAEAVIAWEVAE